jgi:hypothetical protein
MFATLERVIMIGIDNIAVATAVVLICLALASVPSIVRVDTDDQFATASCPMQVEVDQPRDDPHAPVQN